MSDIRWKQRFANFDRAVVLLREPIERGLDSLSALEKEGMIRRFKFAMELAWKTLKDYLEHEGTVVTPVTPRRVIIQNPGTGYGFSAILGLRPCVGRRTRSGVSSSRSIAVWEALGQSNY